MHVPLCQKLLFYACDRSFLRVSFFSEHLNSRFLSLFAFFILMLTLISSLLFDALINRWYRNLYRYGTAHQCVLLKPSQTPNKKVSVKQLVFLSNSSFPLKRNTNEQLSTLLPTAILPPWNRKFRWKLRTLLRSLAPKLIFQASKNTVC